VSDRAAKLCKTVALAGLKGKPPSTRGYRCRESTWYPMC